MNLNKITNTLLYEGLIFNSNKYFSTDQQEKQTYQELIKKVKKDIKKSVFDFNEELNENFLFNSTKFKVGRKTQSDAICFSYKDNSIYCTLYFYLGNESLKGVPNLYHPHLVFTAFNNKLLIPRLEFKDISYIFLKQDWWKLRVYLNLKEVYNR